MAPRPVDETKTVDMAVNNPRLELVHFTTQSTDGDYYDSKKFGRVIGAFATNLTSDGKNIRVGWETLATGQVRIHIYPNQASTAGYLSIEGKK